MRFSPLLEQLIESLRCLPGVGPKTAQRMALLLLTRGRENGKKLANNLLEAMDRINHCERCRIFSEAPLCDICLSAHRDASLLCVVENPIDVTVIEQSGSFRGKYFVLLGRLSPLDGIGPDDIGIDKLKALLEGNKPTTPHESPSTHVREIILAMNPTVEGDATAHYISTLAKQHHIKVTRIAHGVPIGSELEYIDSSTLAHAFAGRGEV